MSAGLLCLLQVVHPPQRLIKNSNKLQETSRVCSAGSSRVPPGSDWESLSSWEKSHGRSLVSHNLRSQVRTSKQTMWKCWFILLNWLSTTQMFFSVTNSDINPNSRGEQGGGLETKTSQTFAPRLDFFELWTFWCRLHQRLFSWRIETISKDWIWRIQNCWIPVSKTY